MTYTRYSVVPEPEEEVGFLMKQAFKNRRCNGAVRTEVIYSERESKPVQFLKGG